jgi:hypothetical protein
MCSDFWFFSFWGGAGETRIFRVGGGLGVEMKQLGLGLGVWCGNSPS